MLFIEFLLYKLKIKCNHFQKNYRTNELPSSDYKDYGAGFMTVREKHWLAGIQTIQFHNTNPLEEDYYFTVSNNNYMLLQL